MKRLSNVLILFSALIGLITCDTDTNTPPDFQNYFVKYYGAAGNQQGVDIVVNDDGTMLLLGNSQEFENDSHFFVVKIDSAGQILWEIPFEVGNGSNEFAVDIEPTNDGNYVIAAQKQISATDVDVSLTKISPDGNIEISRADGFDEKLDSVRSITPLSDGSYLMTGSTNKTKDVDAEIEAFVFKCDADLNFEKIIWIDTYGSGTINQGIKIFEKSPDEYNLFISSNQQALGGFDYNFFFVTLSDNAELGSGITALPDRVDDSGNERLSSVARISSTEGFAMVGTSQSPTGAKTVYTFITGSTPNQNNINSGNEKLNVSANFLENYSGKSIYPSKFGGFFVLADREVTIGNSLTKTIVLIRLDAQGKALWSSSFGSEFNDTSVAVTELPSGKVVIIGTATLDNQEKMVLIKVNVEGRFLN